MRTLLRLAVLLLVPVCAHAQDAVFPVPAGVRTEGIPPIPMSIVEAASPYGQARQARLLGWHPTERRLLIATAFGNVEQIHEVRGPGAARTQLTFFRDGIVNGGGWYGADGRFFVIRKDASAGKEDYQLYRYDHDSGAVTMITDGKLRNSPPYWAPRSRRIAYDSPKRNGKNRDIYVMDPLDPKTERMVMQGEGDWMVAGWSADEKELYVVEAVSTPENYLWRLDVTTGTKTAMTERGGKPTRWRTVQAGAAGVVLALGNRDSDLPAVWRFDVRTSKWTALTSVDDLIENMEVSPDGRTVAVVVDRDSVSRLRLIDAATGRVRSTPVIPPGVITGLAWHRTSGELAFTMRGGTTPNDVFSLDRARKVTRWTTSETGGASLGALPTEEIVKWKGADGLELSGVMYRAASRFKGPRPVIINVHGGPTQHERPRFQGRSNYFRNELGISVIWPNIRGSSGNGRDFEQADNGKLRVNAIKDIGALLDWIAKDPALDKNRVMIVGASYGGYVALASAIEYGDRLRCAQAGFAISDFPSYLESTDMARVTNRFAEYGDTSDPEMRAFLTSISPLTNAAKLKIPVYLVHGGKDMRIPSDQADKMVQAVKKTGVPLWYTVYEEAGHQQLTAQAADFNHYSWTLFIQNYLLN